MNTRFLVIIQTILLIHLVGCSQKVYHKYTIFGDEPPPDSLVVTLTVAKMKSFNPAFIEFFRFHSSIGLFATGNITLGLV